MTEQTPRVLRANEGETTPFGGAADRFMIDGPDTGGRCALVQQLFEPKALAAPLRRHRDEDEFTYVLTGSIGAILGDDEVVGGPGDLIFKPRGQWHTYWNAGDEPASVLELISPAGLEVLFRQLPSLGIEADPEALAELAGRYHCDLDFDRTVPIATRHGLVF